MSPRWWKPGIGRRSARASMRARYRSLTIRFMSEAAGRGEPGGSGGIGALGFALRCRRGGTAQGQSGMNARSSETAL